MVCLKLNSSDKKNIKISFMFSILLLFSGCVSITSEEERLNCLALSQESFLGINCKSIEQCFKEIDSLFPIDSKFLGNEVKEEIFKAKSSAASSWLLISKANENLLAINQACKEKDYKNLPENTNELRTNLIEVSKHIDEFIKHSIKAIALELAEMKTEEIEIAKDSQLFKNYSALNQTIVDFSTKNTTGNSYAAKINRFSSILSEFAKALEIDSKAFNLNTTEILKKTKPLTDETAKNYNFKLMLFFPLFESGAKIFDNILSLKTSLATIKNIPPKGFFPEIANIVGKNDSAFSQFFTEFSEITKNKKKMFEEQNTNYQQTKQNLDLINRTIGEITYGNYLDYIASNLKVKQKNQAENKLVDEIFELQSNFYELEKEKTNLENKLENLEKNKNNKTLGKSYSESLVLLRESEELLEKALIIESAFKESKKACDLKIKEIKNKVNTKELQSNSTFEMKAIIDSKISMYEENKGIEKCIEIMNYFEEFSTIASSNSFQDVVLEEIKECALKLEELSKKANYNDLEVQAISIQRNLVKNYFVLEACRNSLESLNYRLKNSDLVLNSLETIEKALNMISNTKLFLQSKGITEQELQSLYSETKKIEEYLEKSGIKPFSAEKFLAYENTNDSNKLLAEVQKKVSESISKNSKLIYSFNQDENQTKFNVRNDFEKIEASFVIELNFNSIDFNLIHANNLRVLKGEKTRIVFDYLEKGDNKVIFIKDKKEKILDSQNNLEPNPINPIYELDKANFTLNKLERLSSNIAMLEKEFSNLRPDEYAEILSLLPITKERLKELKKIEEKRNDLEKIVSLIKDQNYSEAKILANKIKLDKLSEIVSEAEQESGSSIQKIKELANASYNAAKEKIEASQPSEEAKVLLEESKQSLSQSHYLESIVNSQRAIGNVVAQQKNEVPLIAIGLALVLCIIVLFFLKKKKNDKEFDFEVENLETQELIKT
ncbi:MAG: hypothetical protein QXX06_01290 [Candidatus Diapherotrites archaeon]